MKLSKDKIFYIFFIFLALYVLLFAFVQFLRNQPGIDSMEAIMWGEIAEFGTNKHPPLSGWLMGGFFNLFGQNDHTAYFLGTISIAIGLFFVYKLAKFFMSEEKAACAAMIMPACFYYTYTAFIDNFNCNFVCIAIFPMVAYYYYKSIKENKLKDWVLFGITTGLGFLNKYQILFLLAALFIHFIIFERKQFRQKGLYIALLSGTAVILPHIVWLIKHDFFTFSYMTMMGGAYEGDSGDTITFLDRIFRPLKFIADQILALLPCVGIYLILAYQAKNIQLKNTSAALSDKVFVLCLACGIVLAQAAWGIFSAAYIHGIWGSIMVGFAGMALFYFFPITFNEKSYAFFFKLSCIVLLLWTTALIIFASVHLKHNISYPHQTNIPMFHKLWAEKTNNAPLRYVGGHLDYIFQFRLYDKEHPTIILDTYGYKNPWINHDDVIKSGAMIFSRYSENLEEWVRNQIYELPEDYEIIPEEYEYEIKNKFGKTKKYTVYYTIIPPQKND